MSILNTQAIQLKNMETKIKWNELESMELSNSGKLELRNYLLNQPPQKAWIKKHPLYSNDYLPMVRAKTTK